MTVSKITELTVFESPDGGRTIYARNSGSTTRTLHAQDPKLREELAALEHQKRWLEIFAERAKNPELDRMCHQVEVYYMLQRREE